jgi:hypothetical protein
MNEALELADEALDTAMQLIKARAEIERLRAEVSNWKHHAEQRLIALREVEQELALARKSE